MIVDDHAIVRQGLTQIIETGSNMTVSKETASGREAISFASAGRCNLVLLDISLTDTDGIDVLKHIKQARPDIGVIILSMHPEGQYGLRALRAGASGYLTKDCEASELIEAIKKVYGGRKYITPAIAQLMADDIHRLHHCLPHESLSDREYQVLCMLAKGKRIKDIAGNLGLSPKSVSTYRNRLLQKLKLQNNEQLTSYVRQHHLIDE
ncbi:MAG: response regulator transcription factor [Desulfobacteraceae bacterium]|nr:response regulator transcription factor [Desulfobacteraceae bacterium]